MGDGVTMKICVIGLRGFPDIPGRVESHCESLYNRMARDACNFEIILFGRDRYIGTSPYVTSSGVRIVPAYCAKTRFLETPSNTFVAILRARFEFGAELIHIHGVGPGFLAAVARLLGLRVILTHHGHGAGAGRLSNFASMFQRVGETLGIRNAARTIAVSPTLADRLRQSYPDRADRIQWVPHGADHIFGQALTASAESTLADLGLTSGQYLVAVGHDPSDRGLSDVIRAHKRAETTLPLVIIGDDDRAFDRADTARHKDKRVIMTAGLSQTQNAHLLAHAKLFVMPLQREDLPIIALEAWAMNAPLLLCDTRSTRDLGLPDRNYYTVGDIDALSERLASKAANPPPVSLPEAFSWESIALATAEVYGEVSERFRSNSEPA
ncbi:glycosyltransferase family 4 protein [Gymnodinialimonas ceratoperidinii]|uniref:Glycosyltransferase family 4 protein n=1 Tax=Gymnodinialimonas ceratoperidinii TaxID=2856823 RepID=A0A8F6TWY6_9RHOB|nr:glycosyltransferase family 4 protein [Gymnodinialimonas ceratoperidinii]QXT39449.1 glycosyltransferase family 4 protein [Gymnodinialimonas ceratoperidinii]